MARIDAIKDHGNLIDAFKRILHAHPNLRLVCVGSGDASLKARLIQQTESLGIQQ